MRTSCVLVLASGSLVAAGCKNGPGAGESSEASVASTGAPSGSASGTRSSTAQSAASAQPTGREVARLPDEDIPVAQEFAAESAKVITEKNYKKELQALEKELATPTE
jgi:hypothetical protein